MLEPEVGTDPTEGTVTLDTEECPLMVLAERDAVEAVTLLEMVSGPAVRG